MTFFGPFSSPGLLLVRHMQSDDHGMPGSSRQAQRRRRQRRTRRDILRNEIFGLIWYCDYCDIFVSTNAKTRRQHVTSTRHMDHMEAYYTRTRQLVVDASTELRWLEATGRFIDPNDRLDKDWREPLLASTIFGHGSTVRRTTVSDTQTQDEYGGEVGHSVSATERSSSFHAAAPELSTNPTNSFAARAALENVVRYHPACNEPPAAASSAASVAAASETLSCAALNAASLMAPTHVGGGVVIGGAPTLAFTRVSAAPRPVTVPSVRVGHVVVQEERLVVPFREGDCNNVVTVRVGNNGDNIGSGGTRKEEEEHVGHER